MSALPKVKDIAEVAEVSAATVSRVLNERGSVRPELRERVLSAIAELGYEPNELARSLRVKRTRTLGVLVSDITNPFFAELVRGVEDVAQRQGFSIVLCNSEEDPLKEHLYLRLLRSKRVDAIVLSPSSQSPVELSRTQRLDIAVVCVDRRYEDLATDSVLADNRGGARAAVLHLAEHGYRRMGMISGRLSATTGRERLEGFHQGLSDAGLPAVEELIRVSDFSLAGGREAMKQLLNAQPPPEAVFVANNLMTIGALQVLWEQGVAVPADMALIGFDDMPWAELLAPPLSVVAQPAYELGSTAAALLLERLSGQLSGPPRELRLPTQLIARASCGCRPPAAPASGDGPGP